MVLDLNSVPIRHNMVSPVHTLLHQRDPAAMLSSFVVVRQAGAGVNMSVLVAVKAIPLPEPSRRHGMAHIRPNGKKLRGM